MSRRRLSSEEYDYEIIYKPGKINCNADALSRIKIDNATVQKIEVTENSYQDFLMKIQKSLILYDKLQELINLVVVSIIHYDGIKFVPCFATFFVVLIFQSMCSLM